MRLLSGVAGVAWIKTFQETGRGLAESAEPRRGALAGGLNARRREVLNDFRAAINRMQQHGFGEESARFQQDVEAGGAESGVNTISIKGS